MNAGRIKLLLAGGGLSLAFVAGVGLAPAVAGFALAQTTSPSASQVERGAKPAGDLFKAAADYIGIGVDALRNEMGTAKSMADVAVAHGKTRDGLIAALTAATQTRIEALVDHKGFPAPEKHRAGMAFKVEAFQAVRDYIGLPAGDIQQQLKDGKTLAQIAEAAGKTRDGLINAIVTAETGRIDQAVTSGKLTQDQAAKLKAALPDRVGKMVDATHTKPGLGFGRHERRPDLERP